MACRKGSRDCGDACSVMGEGVMGGGVRGGVVRGGVVRGGGVRGGMTCGASLPLLSTAPFVQKSWRKDLGEGGREGEREGGGREGENE